MAMTDRERVVNRLKRLIKAAHNENYDFIYIPVGTSKLIVKILEEQEAVVRCKDCKHRPTKDSVGLLDFPDNVCPCQNSDDSWYSWYPADNWFCAGGERR